MSRSPLSLNENISFCTMSVSSPMDFLKRAVSSGIGVLISPYPKSSHTPFEQDSIIFQSPSSSGSRSFIPLRAFNMGLPYLLLHHEARLEDDGPFGRNLHGSACLRVPAYARLARLRLEYPEVSEFDRLALREGIYHEVQEAPGPPFFVALSSSRRFPPPPPP